MRTVRILSWNVNGLRAAHRKGFLAWFAQASPDILCLQETKLEQIQLPTDLSHVEGYYSHFASGDRKGYSGVALYTRIKPQQVTTGFGVDAFDKEGRVLIADYGQFVLFNIYFPNGRASEERLAYKMRFYDAFLEFVDNVRDGRRQVVVGGDLNTAHQEIDLARPRANEGTSGFLPEERAWMDKFLSHGYVDTFRMFNNQPGQYTYWDQMSRARERNVGWRIDYFFVNQGFAGQVKAAYILPEVMGSDHCPIGIDISLSP